MWINCTSIILSKRQRAHTVWLFLSCVVVLCLYKQAKLSYAVGSQDGRSCLEGSTSRGFCEVGPGTEVTGTLSLWKCSGIHFWYTVHFLVCVLHFKEVTLKKKRISHLFNFNIYLFNGCSRSKLHHEGSPLWLTGSLVAARGLSCSTACGGFSCPTRDRTRVPCIIRWILN